MATTRKASAIPPKLLAELAKVLENPYEPPDGDEMKQACKQMDKLRKEAKKTTGELDVAVDLIRDARNQ